VTSLGNKNITKIFAGGNHSWAVLDEIMPIREAKMRCITPIKDENESRFTQMNKSAGRDSSALRNPDPLGMSSTF
jgi:hypothetical protein